MERVAPALTSTVALPAAVDTLKPFGPRVPLTGREDRVHIVRTPILTFTLLAWAAAADAQTPLTLAEAMARARAVTPSARALDAAQREAAARVRQARAGYLPRVDITESVQRGNQPVFVFGSLLSQRRFTAANFAIEELNAPAPITHTRTGLAVTQPIWDAGATRLAVQRAGLAREVTDAERAAGGQDLALAAAQVFVRVLQYESAVQASAAAVAAAESDRARAGARRDVGLATEADVLAVDVHLADMRQRHAATEAELEIARLELNAAVGAAPDERITPVRPALPDSAPASVDLVRDALATRPELRAADLAERLAVNGRAAARAAFLPSVSAQGGWEFNGPDPGNQRASWIVGAEVRLNVFNGLADRARLAEARHAEARVRAQREAIARRVSVDVQAATARLQAARARERVGASALAQAREAQRIVRDRYGNGLATVTDVLRAAEAAVDAESRATAAAMDVIMQTVALDRAVGRL